MPHLRLTLAVLALLFGLTSAAARGATLPPRPNIILILADDMGYSDLGCYGGEIATPHLDHLAAQGLRFTQFYNSAKCEPTRASLMSGQYWQDTGLGVKRGPTMGEVLRRLCDFRGRQMAPRRQSRRPRLRPLLRPPQRRQRLLQGPRLAPPRRPTVPSRR